MKITDKSLNNLKITWEKTIKLFSHPILKTTQKLAPSKSCDFSVYKIAFWNILKLSHQNKRERNGREMEWSDVISRYRMNHFEINTLLAQNGQSKYLI